MKLGTISAVTNTQGITILVDGEDAATTKKYSYLASYTPTVGDRVIFDEIGGSYVIIGKLCTDINESGIARYCETCGTATTALSCTGTAQNAVHATNATYADAANRATQADTCVTCTGTAENAKKARTATTADECAVCTGTAARSIVCTGTAQYAVQAVTANRITGGGYTAAGSLVTSVTKEYVLIDGTYRYIVTGINTSNSYNFIYNG